MGTNGRVAELVSGFKSTEIFWFGSYRLISRQKTNDVA